MNQFVTLNKLSLVAIDPTIRMTEPSKVQGIRIAETTIICILNLPLLLLSVYKSQKATSIKQLLYEATKMNLFQCRYQMIALCM